MSVESIIYSKRIFSTLKKIIVVFINSFLVDVKFDRNYMLWNEKKRRKLKMVEGIFDG